MRSAAAARCCSTSPETGGGFVVVFRAGCLRPLLSVRVSNLDTSPVASISARTVSDGGGTRLNGLGDLPIGLLGRGLDQLGDQLAPLLSGQVAPMQICRDDICPGIDVPTKEDEGLLLGGGVPRLPNQVGDGD